MEQDLGKYLRKVKDRSVWTNKVCFKDKLVHILSDFKRNFLYAKISRIPQRYQTSKYPD